MSSSSSSSSFIMGWIGMSMSLLAFLLLLLVGNDHSVEAFLFDSSTLSQPSIVLPGLDTMVRKKLVGMSLELRIIASKPNDPQSLLALNGLQLELLDETSSSTSTIFPMPGFNGPLPHLSSGSRQAKVVQNPSFVGQQGFHQVDMMMPTTTKTTTTTPSSSCWELIWRQGDAAGNLMCGITIPEEIQRNDHGAKIAPGKIYLSFLVWTHASYQRHLQQIQMAQDTAQGHWDTTQSLLDEYDATNNAWIKIQKYQSAKQQHQQYLDYYRLHESLWKRTPQLQDLIPISSPTSNLSSYSSSSTGTTTSGGMEHNEDLLVLTKGTAWAYRPPKTMPSWPLTSKSAGAAAAAAKPLMAEEGYTLLGRAQLTDAFVGKNTNKKVM